MLIRSLLLWLFLFLISDLIHSIGRNIKLLIDRQDEPHVFRLHKDRVYYVPYASL